MTFRALTVARWTAMIRVAAGAVVLVVPAPSARAIAGHDAALPSAWLIRLLATRWVAQGLGEIRYPTRSVLAAGAVVDAAHGLSMLAVAAHGPAHRRAAVASAAIAAIGNARAAAGTPPGGS